MNLGNADFSEVSFTVMLEVFAEAIFEQYMSDKNDKEILLARLESTYRGQNELNELCLNN